MSTMIVQDFVVGYALLPVLAGVEAVVAVLAKEVVILVVPGVVRIPVLAVVPGVVRIPVLAVVPGDVILAVLEDVQELVRIHALLVRMVVLMTAQVIVMYCAKADARDAPVDVQGLVNHLVLVLAKGVAITALVNVLRPVQEDADHLAETLFSATILVWAINK